MEFKIMFRTVKTADGKEFKSFFTPTDKGDIRFLSVKFVKDIYPPIEPCIIDIALQNCFVGSDKLGKPVLVVKEYKIVSGIDTTQETLNQLLEFFDL